MHCRCLPCDQIRYEERLCRRCRGTDGKRYTGPQNKWGAERVSTDPGYVGVPLWLDDAAN